MINQDRIVPVTKTDLLSLYALILKSGITASGGDVVPLEAEETGVFEVNEIPEGEFLFANEPLKSCTVDISVSGTFFFVPAYDFDGFVYDGNATGLDSVVADGCTLYRASIHDGLLQLHAFGF